MSDLFDLPESPLPPLEAARRRLDKLMDDLVGAPPPTQNKKREILKLMADVRRLEQEALRK